MLSFRLNQLAQAGAGLPHPTRAIAVAAILINVFMATLESAIANTALPAIAADLGVSEASSIWVISAYHLAMVAALLPIASLGEIIGHRRISMAGLVLFTLASLACGLAPSLPWLIAGRLAQGVGAAGILGVALAMTRFVYPREQLGRGLGLNALVVSLSLAAGPTAASLILSLGSWHWLFLINVPLGLLGLALGVCALPPTPRSARRYDAVAGLLCALFLALLVYTLNAYAHDVGAGGNTAYALATLAMLALLLRRQSGRGAPMLATDLLRRPIFALSAAATLGAFAAQTLAFVALPFMLQSLLGYTQVQTGFLITPWPALAALSAASAGALSDRHPPGLLGGIGMAVLAAGLLSLVALPAAPDAFDLGWRMALCGAGFGFFQAPNMRAMLADAPPERSGGASGMTSSSIMLGQSLGAALVAGLFTLRGAAAAPAALWLGVAFAVIAGIASLLRLRHAAAAGAGARLDLTRV
ncbi:transporter, major facilitator family protein [Bordetella bronchiseptica 980-2]|nr:transporter, major facilitator family protein [Bordetella bronchiseptica 980-2]KCV53804.1 transporter, major facilitator family protein [Bordetella bronchiseptica 3E44]KDB64872.1 transporter, major facilitator family protein [Bordetella bronchiseptica B18-5 (C3)]KDB81368.1 transporter, major facilitator family protein [Bordetella bronchiseptica D756]KDB91099.1 transporter, major facilitator family protein [Bordetella bronchiseptica D989]KDC44980.1 transporter, major facilitator family prote